MTTTQTRPDCARCGQSHDLHQHNRRGTDAPGCAAYRKPSRIGRVWRRVAAVFAAVVVLSGGVSALNPPVVYANDPNCGTTAKVLALIGFEHSNYGGRQYNIYRPSCGAVDAGGYDLRGTTAARNNVSSVKRGPYGGSGLIIWESNWTGTGINGTICFYGSIGAGVPYVGDACNDDTGLWGIYK